MLEIDQPCNLSRPMHGGGESVLKESRILFIDRYTSGKVTWVVPVQIPDHFKPIREKDFMRGGGVLMRLI